MEKFREDAQTLFFHLAQTLKELNVVASDPAHNIDTSEDVESLKLKVKRAKDLGSDLIQTEKDSLDEISETIKKLDEYIAQIERKLQRVNQVNDLKVKISLDEDFDDRKSDEDIDSPAEYINYISSCLAELNEDVKEIEEEIAEYVSLPDFVDLLTRQSGLEGLAAIRIQLHDLEDSKFESYRNDINSILLNRDLEPYPLKEVKKTLQSIEKRIQDALKRINECEHRIEGSLDEYLRTAYSWKNPEVIEWLQCQGLGKFASKFEESNVVGSMLLNDFDESILRDDFGLSLVHARHLLREIKNLQETIKEQEDQSVQHLIHHLNKQMLDLKTHEESLLASQRIMDTRTINEKKRVKESFDAMLKNAFIKIDDSFASQKSRIEDELSEVREKIRSVSTRISGTKSDSDVKSEIFKFITDIIDRGKLNDEEEKLLMSAYFKRLESVISIFDATRSLKNEESAQKHFVYACKALFSFTK